MDRILANEKETEVDLARKTIRIQPRDQVSIYVKLSNFVDVWNHSMGSHPSLRQKSFLSWLSIERSTSNDTNVAPITLARKNFDIFRNGFIPRHANTTPSETHREEMREERRDRNPTRRAFLLRSFPNPFVDSNAQACALFPTWTFVRSSSSDSIYAYGFIVRQRLSVTSM